MILNVLERKISSLSIDLQLKQHLVAPLQYNSKFHGCTKTNTLISISFTYIKLCDTLISQNKIQDSQIVLDFIRQIMSQIYLFEESYAWSLLKTRLVVLRIRFLQKKMQKVGEKLKKKTKEEKEIYLERIINFCEEISKSKHFQLLKSDYYSYIEVIFLYAIRKTFREKEYFKCTNFIKHCVNIINSQLDKLCQLLSKQDKKVFRIIQSKTEILLKVYGFQASIMIRENNYDQPEQLDAIWEKYEDIFQKVPNIVSRTKIDKLLIGVFMHKDNDVHQNEPLSSQVLNEQNTVNIFSILSNTKKVGILKCKKESSTYLMKEISSNSISPEEAPLKKIRVKFADADIQNTLNKSQISSGNSSQSSLPSEASRFLSKLTQHVDTNLNISNRSNRFMSIQYSPLAHDNAYHPKSVKKIEEAIKQNDESLLNDQSQCIQEQKTNLFKNQEKNNWLKREKLYSVVGYVGQKQYDRTIFRVAKSHSRDILQNRKKGYKNEILAGSLNLNINDKRGKIKITGSKTFFPFLIK